MEKYKSYGTFSKTTHFLTVFCEAGVVQQCAEAQAGIVQDGLRQTLKHVAFSFCSILQSNTSIVVIGSQNAAKAAFTSSRTKYQ